MWFTIYKVESLNTNERMISFYKKELQLSHIIDTAKKFKFYGTKHYRKTFSNDVPSKRRYARIKALVGTAYKKNNAKYKLLVQLGKIV